MIEILQQTPIERYKASDRYLVLLNIIVFQLVSDVPVAKYICKPQLQEDVRLFDVNLLKWKLLIEEVFNYLFLIF